MKTRRPFSVYLLWLIIFFQSLSGLFGGFSLISDPSGASLRMPLTFLEGTPFNTYLVPGIILFLLLGVFPGITFIGLIGRKHWRRAQQLNTHRNKHWSWTFSIYTAIILILWIDFQVLMIGYESFLQTLYALVGVAILIFALSPGTMQHYAKIEQ